ncbi:acid protease [Thozetella sp. PMI_491]|nr:acid protease [Thozetella sp. PMI_491]
MATFAVLSLALASLSSASILPRALNSDNKFISFPIKRSEAARPLTLDRRDNSVTLYNVTQVTYLFELQIGTPAQKVDVVLDTGSFELWVDPSCSTASTAQQIQQCEAAGTYDPSTSKTVKDLQVTKKLTYGKGEVDIQYISDNIAITGSNGTTMKNVVFGLGQGSDELAFGIAGVGHGLGFNFNNTRNLIDELQHNNITNGRSFSVALASKDANNGGVVIFGGIDTKKFTGSLMKFTNLEPQMESGRLGPWRYWIQMDSVGITKPGSSSKTYSSSGQAIVLDTGSTLSYLPRSVISQLGSDMGATTASDGTLSVPCSLASQSGTVDFTFSGFTLKVPYHEFIWEVEANQCFVGVAPQSSGTTALLGDSFLRSAYMVMDQDNEAIYLAQYSNCGQNEKTFVPGTNYTGECSAAKVNASPRSVSSSANMWTLGAIGLGFQLLMMLF